MKALITLLPTVFLAAGLAHGASLLLNGGFTNGADRDAPGDGFLAVDWTQTNTGGWNNREINSNGITPTDFHLALGNSGPTDNTAYQILPGTAGLTYQFSVDSGSPDSWWKPNGEAKMEFLDAGGDMISDALVQWTMPDFDTLLPWDNYSVTATAPAGTMEIRATLSNQGPNGGTMRFDNASLDVVPEPATTGLFALGSLVLLGRRSRRS